VAQRPTHRLNLYLVPEKEPSDASVDGLLAALGDWGVLQGVKPGPTAGELVEGGFAMMRVDRPGRELLYGNRQGGFHVRCPTCSENLVRQFSKALGSNSAVECPACELKSDPRRLAFEPPVAFGSLAVEVRDVGAPELSARGQAVVSEHLGPFQTIGSRG
jgi:hypothetical protein